MKYIQPKLNSESFTCPNCGVLSKQRWENTTWGLVSNYSFDYIGNVISTSLCDHCQESSLWIKDIMYFPTTGNSPFPNPEMPENVKKLYLEASSIATKSPRGATALLRLSIQLLCKELGEKGENINNDIKELVKKGLPEIVQKSLDIVRVTGNDAVHPGQIDTDDIIVLNRMFDLINVIVEYMIALPKKVSGIYDTLPDDKLKGIEIRDK
nr:DUF4145 domain-containing protein [Flavobacterium sp.]